MEPFLITLEISITEGAFVGLSYIDPKPPRDRHYGSHNIGVERLEEMFKQHGLASNIPELHMEKGKRTVKIDLGANERILAALGFSEVGSRPNP